MIWEELLESSKHGVWTLSKKGWVTTLTIEQAHIIFLKWVKIYQELREKKTSKSVDNEAEIINQLQEDTAPENSKTDLKLIEVLQNLPARGFELLCGRLLREFDFENIEITQQSHDGGIDGYAILKLNPFVNLSVYFQCKRYLGTVPTEKVQAFIGVMETNKRSVEKGPIITEGTDKVHRT